MHPLEGGAGLFAVVLEEWGLGAVTPGSWTVVFGAVAVLRHGGSHKLNLRLRAYWGWQDMTALSPLKVLPQPQTTPDTLATEPKRNCI